MLKIGEQVEVRRVENGALTDYHGDELEPASGLREIEYSQLMVFPLVGIHTGMVVVV